MTASDLPESQPSCARPARVGKWRVAMFVFAALVTLVALFYAEESIRGRLAWNRYQHQLEAQGQWHDLRSFVPPPVPDDQNFAATPLLARFFDYIPGTYNLKDSNAWRVMEKIPISHAPSGLTNTMVNFGECFPEARGKEIRVVGTTNLPIDRAAEARHILEVLKTNTTVFDEIEAAAGRPSSRFNIDYLSDDVLTIRLPHLGMLIRCAAIFSVRACAELAIGQTDLAMRDVAIGFRLTDAVKDEPLIISCAVRCRLYAYALQPIWEGMAHHQWSETQVREIERQLKSSRLFDHLKISLQADTAATDVFFQQCLAHPSQTLASMRDSGLLDNYNQTWISVRRWIVPSGWMYLDRIENFEAIEKQFAPLVDFTAGRIDPIGFDRVLHQAAETARTLDLWKDLIIKERATWLRQAFTAVAQTQSRLDCAIVSCALERYRQANGQLPDKLNKLVPAYLEKIPNDVIDGQPLRYRLTSSGQPFLYAIGWDAKDDGGSEEKVTGGQLKDWVWQYPD